MTFYLGFLSTFALLVILSFFPCFSCTTVIVHAFPFFNPVDPFAIFGGGAPGVTFSLSLLDLVVLGCKVSEGSIYSVMDAIESIRPILNLHEQPPTENLSPAEAKLYLERHYLKYCVLVVDGETIQDSYENLPARKDEYEDLLKTAVKRVGKISSL